MNDTRQSTRRAILEQKYKVAVELRQLAALEHGRFSAPWIKADEKCKTVLAKVEAAR